MCSHLLVVQFTEQLTSLSFSFTSKINVFSHKTLVHFFHFSDCSYVWQGGLSLLKAATFQVLKNISDCSFWTKANCSKQSKEHVILPLQYTMSCKLFLPTTKTIMLLACKVILMEVIFKNYDKHIFGYVLQNFRFLFHSLSFVCYFFFQKL